MYKKTHVLIKVTRFTSRTFGAENQSHSTKAEQTAKLIWGEKNGEGAHALHATMAHTLVALKL